MKLTFENSTIGVSKESKVKYCSFSTDKYRVSKVCMKRVRYTIKEDD